MSTGALTVVCPAMKVRKNAAGEWWTDLLPAKGTFVGPDGVTVAFPFTFPSVRVTKDRWWDPFHWTVAECPAFSSQAYVMPRVTLLLPPEPCVVNYSFSRGLYMVARRIVASGQIVTQWATGKASCVFPDDNGYPTGPDEWTMDPVTTEDGEVVW